MYPPSAQLSPVVAHRFLLTGRVQGVGFRPFVFRLAARHRLSGWVRNLTGQVEIHVQGSTGALDAFGTALLREAPPLARPQLLDFRTVETEPDDGFRILPSEAHGAATVHVPPDYFACDDCLDELHSPRDRRHRYPFINCTQCGPRYTLINRLPYDRPNTTMAGFALCPVCQREYENPLNRRFHAEPVACPACGPQLLFRDADGEIADTASALSACFTALREGHVVAVKGIGGYHLLCDARNDEAVAWLREQKSRPHKPLAVMFPWRGADGLDAVREAALPNAAQERLLRDPMRPIVLIEKRPQALSDWIAPGLKEIGCFLPYSPLHHLILDDFGGPLVATSGNISGEPVLTDNAEAEARLRHMTEAFLHHDRPIARPADDPVYRVIAGSARPLRLGRGVAPLELELPLTVAEATLAVGGHMKNTVALAWGNRAVVSPHIGDLDSPRALAVFEQVIADLQQLYGVPALRVVCDAHPGYASTRFAKQLGLPLTQVFHHHAHASALAGEYPEIKHWLVFTWDGVGYGEDGSLWGGEALLGKPGGWKRVASFRPFRLPGGERAGREPWRSAISLAWEIGTKWKNYHEDTTLLRDAWEKRLNTPQTSAVGRLFDAAAAFTGLNYRSTFEGQGPMLLEAAVNGDAKPIALPLLVDGNGILRASWAPLVPMLMDSYRSRAEGAAIFHASLAQSLVDQAKALREKHGAFTVGLSGGVFQNRVLTEAALARLAAAGFDTCLGQQIPCNDAGISYGQIIEAASR